MHKKLSTQKAVLVSSSALVILFLSFIYYGLRNARYLHAYLGILGLATVGCSAPLSKVIGERLEDKIERETEILAINEENYQLGLAAGRDEVNKTVKEQWSDWEYELEKSHRRAMTDLQEEASSHLEKLLSVEREKQESLEAQIAQLTEEREGLESRCVEGDRTVESLRFDLKKAKQRIEILESEQEWLENEKRKLQGQTLEFQKNQGDLNNLKDQLRMERDNIISEKLQIAESKGRVENMNTRLMEQSQLMRELQHDLKIREEESERAIEEEFQKGYQTGVQVATTQWSVEREKLLLQVERLKVRVSQKEAIAALEKRLLELRDVIKTERKPFIIVGSQGSGKALAAAEIANCYGGSAGVLPFVLDISEGGSDASTWHKLKIPNTADPRLFLSWMETIVAHLEPGEQALPFRNERAKYDAVPAIVILIDELMTCINDLDKEEHERFVNCMKAFESRGNKRKVFVGFLTQNAQIQNLNKVTNTGRLELFYHIYLNDGLIARCSKEILDKSDDLRDYIELYRENYKAGIGYKNAKGDTIKPIKHPSHWGNKIDQTFPARVPEVKLKKPYDWFPPRVRELFNTYLEKEGDPVEEEIEDGKSEEGIS